MVNLTENEHILELSRELLDDIELDRLASDKLLLKCNRLARLTGSDEIREWLGYEMQGYNGTAEVSLRYMNLTGRWTDFKEKKGYWEPLAVHESTIEILKARIDATKITSVEGDWAFRVTNDTRTAHASMGGRIAALTGVRSRVLGLLHTFISGIYYERQFANVAADTFETYKRSVDILIAEKAGAILIKMPSVVARLKEGDSEAVSQALTTCRRILEALADAIFPPKAGTYEIGGNQISLDASKHQNRLNAYIAQRTDSESRRTRLRQNLKNLFDRVSTGVHNDVDAAEAFALFLNVYLFLGEVLSLPEQSVPETEG
ncbi:hypothetical protein HGO38_15770 [Rhizobium sp. CG5]|uniref:AbiTii domain-containing protein n=1 Tax=Rhizobium sp. CG5 TaxID=2726076 RepID=UPI00203381F4|nr:hypothetical protein [Rhizobium sp. CG5]MCM2474940.1 hypothetical protein [Rhizobium sp. CG5]